MKVTEERVLPHSGPTGSLFFALTHSRSESISALQDAALTQVACKAPHTLMRALRAGTLFGGLTHALALA